MQNTLNESPRIGCIGCGNMGGALVRGIAGSGLASSITVMDVRPEASAELAAACGASAVSSIGDLAAGSDIVILAVNRGRSIPFWTPMHPCPQRPSRRLRAAE